MNVNATGTTHSNVCTPGGFLARWTACTLPFVLAALLAAASSGSNAQSPIDRQASSFDRHFAVNPAFIEKVRESSNLSGVSGWFEYDVVVAEEGWHEFILDTGFAEGDFSIIEKATGKVVARILPSFQSPDKVSKLANVYLAKGPHIVRLANEFWTGHRALTGFRLQRAPSTLGGRLRVIDESSPIQRMGACRPLTIQAGPTTEATSIDVVISDAGTNATVGRTVIQLPASRGVSLTQWTPPCDRPGNFVLFFTNAKEKLTNRDVRPYAYQVFDTSPAKPAPANAPARTLLHSIDLVKQPPDFESTPTQLVQKPFGSYRESGTLGWVTQQQVRRAGADASWFAYSIPDLTPQQPHIVEIDYPDDARRTFQIALREPNPIAYPVAGGVESGGEFRVSNSIKTQTLVFWPRGKEARVLFMPLNDNQRAAASAIRVYKLDGPLPPMQRPVRNSRVILNWYEEGSNFVSMYGAPDARASGTRAAVERWIEAAAHQGINMLMPTAVIYESGMFPSAINRHFSRPWLGALGDPLRQIVLAAERHEMRVVPELHPRADELLWPFRDQPDPKPNLLISRNGQTGGKVPPMFNPLHPDNERWYIGLIGELAEQFKDSPSFGGVSLRVMGWRTPTLNNLYSLDWGYDDFTIQLFEKETGTRVPVSETSSERYQLRYAWIMSNARERWIAWRCEKIAGLLTRIVARLRQVRPDLELYLPVFPITITVPSWPYFAGTDWMREAGLDPRLLASIDGLVVINSLHLYGRRWNEKINAVLRDHLVSESSRNSLVGPDRMARYMTTAVYLESLRNMAPPESLGFPKGTRRGYTSAVGNPPGRLYLERFALLLAENDAVMLGDGGNAFTIGQPELREFAIEYRELPAVPFEQRSSSRDPVVVRDHQSGDERVFYMVNRTEQDATVRVRIKGADQVVRASTRQAVSLNDQVLEVKLMPYQLITFRMPRGASIVSASSGASR